MTVDENSVLSWPAIAKTEANQRRPANLVDYEQACRRFAWDAERLALDPTPGTATTNIAFQAVDRHALGDRANHCALRFLSRGAPAVELTYEDLRLKTNRFANVLQSLGVGRGDRVFSLLGRVPELYVAAIGALKAGCVFSPLFSAFGPEPIRKRLEIGEASAIVTTSSFYRRKLVDVVGLLPRLSIVLLVDETAPGDLPEGCYSLPDLMAAADDRFEALSVTKDDVALLHFTSGTTGTPKGAIHVHDAVVSHHVTGTLALDLHDDDIFWCTADPGWVTGTSYGIISPLTHGITTVVDREEFDATRWYQILQDERVTVWYTAPTALRMLMRAGTELAAQYDLSNLKFIASVGEPLNPQVVVWGQEALGLPIHDNWWQTETGGIMIANFAAMEIRPGSMGRPLPGIVAAVARRDENDELIVRENVLDLIEEPDVEGELVLRPGWPSMFRGYYHEEERYAHAFVAGWYHTGDLVRRDADGYFWFVGRGDDVIKSAGHLIGPFEVENCLLEHPAVAEAGVIGLPDPMVGETVKAFVTLRPGYSASEQLRLELIGWGRKRLGAAVAPKEIAFDVHLPRTNSGKIMRRLLRARELGLPEGDISTLETSS
jgi:acetyl-CoA synthetase